MESESAPPIAGAPPAHTKLMLVLATGLLATALLATGCSWHAAVHRPVLRLSQSLRCIADPDPATQGGDGDGADGLTMGDLLAAIAKRQQGSLPLEGLIDETRGSLDAMIEFGSDELDSIAADLASDLRSVQRNASSAAAELRSEAEQAILQRFDRSADVLRSEAAAEREAIKAVRLKLDELVAVRAASREAEQGGERARARGRGWYDDATADGWLQARLVAAERLQPELLRAAQLSTSAIGLLGLLGLLSLALGPDAVPGPGRLVWGAGLAAALAVYLSSMARILIG